MAEGIDKYLNDILTKIYANQNLCKYLFYDVRNPLAQATIANTKVLKDDKDNQKIFITPFTVDVTDKTKTTLTIMINDFQLDSDTKYYEDMTVEFIIACNVRLWELDDGSNEVKLRVNGIWDELSKTFKRKATVGIGKNNFKSGRLQKFNDYFWGYSYCLEAKDFPLQSR
jgi:hypothetical protein